MSEMSLGKSKSKCSKQKGAARRVDIEWCVCASLFGGIDDIVMIMMDC